MYTGRKIAREGRKGRYDTGGISSRAKKVDMEMAKRHPHIGKRRKMAERIGGQNGKDWVLLTMEIRRAIQSWGVGS